MNTSQWKTAGDLMDSTPFDVNMGWDDDLRGGGERNKRRDVDKFEVGYGRDLMVAIYQVSDLSASPLFQKDRSGEIASKLLPC